MHSSIDQARSPATQKQYSKGATFPRVDGIGVHTTGIHSVKDMTASFQKQLEEVLFRDLVETHMFLVHTRFR